MDALTFIAKIIESIAWPVAAVILVMLLKAEIQSLLPFIKRLKAGPLEAEFERELRELRTSVETEPAQPSTEKPLSTAEQKLLQLIEINPRSAILEAWQGVEAYARKLVIDLGIYDPGSESRPLLDTYRAIAKANLLPLEDLALFHELRSLRNQAAHAEDFNPTKEAALNYVQLANRLRAKLGRPATGVFQR